MGEFPIDVDAEAVFLDGTWYTRAELSKRIKTMLDGGDFNVARPSLALQELTLELQQVRTMDFRCLPDLADALNQMSMRLGQSTGYIIREALMQYITDANSAPMIEPDDIQVSVAPTGVSHQSLPNVIVEPAVAVVPVAGPGALKAAGIGDPVELTNPKKMPL